jgi:hypothetical protein
MFSFSKRVIKRSTDSEARTLYRRILKNIKYLDPKFQKVYYDYARLKFKENKSVKDEKQIKKLLINAVEEIQWLESVLSRKENPK